MFFWCNQSHGKTVFYPFPKSSSICCWDLGSVCLSQHTRKLAGEEGLACANYSLIIGNVLANQASIAILEHIAPLCRLRTEECSVRVWKCGWDQTGSWMHGSPPQLDMAVCLVYTLGTELPLLTETRDGEVGLHGTLILRFCLTRMRTPTSTGTRYTARALDPQMSGQRVPPHMTHNIAHPENTQKRHINMRKSENNPKVFCAEICAIHSLY